MRTVIFKAMTPLALQTISLANSTAVAVNSTTATADVLVFSVSSVDARMRCDSTAPTNNTGVVYFYGNTYILDGYNGTGALRFNRSGASGTSTVEIQPFKYGS